MRILLFSKYGQLGASSRLRSYQYFPALENAGIHVDAHPLFDDAYLERRYGGTWSVLVPLVRGYLRRAMNILSRSNYDLIWIEKELFPWLPSSLDLNRLGRDTPIVVDYDDAIFHKYDMNRHRVVRQILGQKIDGVMRNANMVIAGNAYIAERAMTAGANQVRVIPTSIDLTRYLVKEQADVDAPYNVGWIGTPYTSVYLRAVAPALRALANSGEIRISLIGCSPDADLGFGFDAIPWSSKTEVQSLLELDCGIMPLPDDPFERGKCGYKILQYMACGLPVVASPVGVNTEIVKDGSNGLLASSEKDWRDAISRLAHDRAAATIMGQHGRKDVERSFSMSKAAADLIDSFRLLIST